MQNPSYCEVSVHRLVAKVRKRLTQVRWWIRKPHCLFISLKLLLGYAFGHKTSWGEVMQINILYTVMEIESDLHYCIQIFFVYSFDEFNLIVLHSWQNWTKDNFKTPILSFCFLNSWCSEFSTLDSINLFLSGNLRESLSNWTALCRKNKSSNNFKTITINLWKRKLTLLYKKSPGRSKYLVIKQWSKICPLDFPFLSVTFITFYKLINNNLNSARLNILQ